MSSSAGFDNPSGDKSKDDLDRWRFALDISEVISTSPPDWSIRIGLFGRWGAGKTTVLRFLSTILVERGSIVVEFNPSFDSSFSDVMASFGMKLIEELERHKLYVEPKIKKIARRFRFLQSKTSLSAVEATSDWFKGAKLASVGLGAISAWLQPTGEQIRKLCEKLSDQRVVVLVDDLDRTSAALLPQFLLALREVLDLPRFAFVFAFDDAIVAEALKRNSPEWKRGEDFLEKILDFRFALPSITDEEKNRLLARALREHAEFVPSDSVSQVADLIPDNPRKLKGLIRGFRSIRTIIERHGRDEFSWTDVWLAELLQQESHIVLQRLGDGDEAFDRVLGVGFHVASHDLSSERRKVLIEERVSELLGGLSLPESSKTKIEALLEAMRHRATRGLHYVIGWFLRPPAITWKEFDEIIQTWGETKSAAYLTEILASHAIRREDSLGRVQQEFFDALSGRADELLDKANRSGIASERGLIHEQLHALYELLVSFFEIPNSLTPERFLNFYQKAMFWIGVRGFDSDQELRRTESSNLVAFSKSLKGSDAVALYEKLQPWAGRPIPPIEVDDGSLRAQLRDSIISVVKPHFEVQLAEFLLERGSFRRLGEPGKYTAYKAVLFTEMALRGSAVRGALLNLLRDAETGDVAYENVRDFDELLVSALSHHARDIGSAEVEIFARDEELLNLLWRAECSRELLPRRIFRMLAIRDRFLELGASREAMPLNHQLVAHVESFEKNRDEIVQRLFS